MYHAVLTLAWFVGTIYATIPLFWLIVHPFAERLRACHWRYRIIVPCWFAMIAVICFMTWRWRDVVLYHAPGVWLASAVLFLASIFMYRRSHLDFSSTQAMGRSELEPSQKQRLVTSGLRQHIRHPIYLAHLGMLLAWTLGSGEVVLYGLTVLALFTGWPMIRQEEAELERRFGDEYRAYKRAVPARFLPNVFHLAKARQR